jgi:hypothetical protein
MAAFLGMRGTGDWATNQRPENWRQGILLEYPNGKAPLTAMQSMLKSESTDDPKFHWFTKALPTQAGSVTDIYTDQGLGTSYVSGGSAGDILYVKMAEALSDEIREGHEVLLRDTSDPDVDCIAVVNESVQNGASSYIAVRLLEDDDNSSSNDLSDCDRVLVLSSGQAEGEAQPDAVAYDPTEYSNYTQIHETSLELTRTARKTRLRTREQYKESKREALEIHSIEMEKQKFFGIYAMITGDNGKPKRFSRGIVPAIKEYASSNSINMPTLTAHAGKTWLQYGEEAIDTYLEQVFRFGGTEKMGFCGSGALLGIQRLVKAVGFYNFDVKTVSYGIKVVEWVTPFGTLYLKSHPLFSYETTNRNAVVIVDPSGLKERPLDNTFFKPDKSYRSGGRSSIDGLKESFLTEVGDEHHTLDGMMYWTGVGTDNSL